MPRAPPPPAASEGEDSECSPSEVGSEGLDEAGIEAGTGSDSHLDGEAADAEAEWQASLEPNRAGDDTDEDIAEGLQEPQLSALDPDDPLWSMCNGLEASWLMPSIGQRLLELVEGSSLMPALGGKKLRVAAIMALASSQSYVLVDVNKGSRDVTMLSWWKCFAAWVSTKEEGHFEVDNAKQVASKLLRQFYGRHVFGQAAVEAFAQSGRKPSKGTSA